MLDKLFIWALNMSLMGSYVIVFVLVARLLLKKAPKIFSYALWGIVLFRLLCPFSFESVLSLMPMAKAPIPQDIIYSTTPQINTGIAAFDSVVNPILSVPSNIGDSVNPIQIWLFIGAVIWVFGMVAMVIYSVVAFIKLKRSLIGAAPFKANSYLADHISSPFVMGMFKPKIYLPSSLSDSEKDFIIAHEMCHIRRFDHVTRILGFVALTIHWFNPLVWIAFIVSGKDMEMSCDEAVMKKVDTDIRAKYSQSLLHFATGRKLICATPLTFGEGNTKDRVKNVMKYKRPVLWVSVIAIIAVICVTIGLMSNPKTEPVPKETGSVSVENLWRNRTEYVGDNSAVGNILYELSFPDNVQYQNFELKTKEQPYEIIVHFDGINNALKSVDYGNGQTEAVLNTDFAQFEQNARIMFSLIGNVEKITFLVNRKESGTITSDYMRNNYDELFTKTVAYEGFQIVLAEILDNSDANTIAAFEAIKIDDYIPKPLTHDQAVASALFSMSDRYFPGECFSEGHIILGYNDSDKDKTKIYALTTIGWYRFENENFVEVSGSGFPAVITLFSDNRVEIEEPLDGSDNATSIEKMFPKEYHDKVFKYGDAERDNLKRQREKYASEYLSKIGRNAKIGEYSDFEHTSLTDLGVSVEVSNNLEVFYKEHYYYPSFIGNREEIENGVRMIYEMSYLENQNEVRFTKYDYDTKQILEQFIADSKTGNIVE